MRGDPDCEVGPRVQKKKKHKKLSRKLGTNKTVRARIWPWLLGDDLETFKGVLSSRGGGVSLTTRFPRLLFYPHTFTPSA